MNGSTVKPATKVDVGDRIEAHLAGRERIVIVTRLITKRVGASIAIECYDDRSPPPPERVPDTAVFAVRDRGAGRPTKRDRRKIDELRGRTR